MYEIKTRKGKANLYKTDKNTYAVNLSVDVSKEIYGKSRKRIPLFLVADSRDSTVKALQHLENIQALIEASDWQGLFRYEESLRPKVVKGEFVRSSLKSLWTDYKKAKQEGWEASYIENDIKEATRVVENCPEIYLGDDLNILINYLMEITTIKQTKRYLKQFSACLTWGKRRGLVKENPLPSFIQTLTTKKKNDDESDINPFTIAERDLIIEAFKTGRFERYKGTHSQYADYIEFSFFTGARTSEVLGLKWSHIDFAKKIITFQEARVLATNGNMKRITQKRGLKTQKKRQTPLSDRVYNLLLNRKRMLNPTDLEQRIFENINHHTFRTGAYKYILEKLGIKYRKPYQTRHTFITIMANHSDLKLHQIAKICGTSIKVIEEHYLATNSNVASLPDI
ncbi:MAG: site-specific integrase [Xenococcaceae cyanobacterium]